MNQRYFKSGTLLTVLSLLLITNVFEAAAQSDPYGKWQFVESPQLSGDKEINPIRYKTASINMESLLQRLDAAPAEFAPTTGQVTIISLPYPDGTYRQFRVYDSPMMEPGLQEKYPHFKTWKIYGVDDPSASGRLSFTSLGFHGLVLGKGYSVYIDPYNRENQDHVISYYRSDFTRTYQQMLGAGRHEPIVYDAEFAGDDADILNTPILQHGTQMRIYRAAVATTAQYTIFHGGTVESGLAAVVVAMNRVNGIYERDVAVRMVLIDNNDLIIYTDPNNQPYTNNNGSQMLTQNVNNLNEVIGNANFDIGHVFSTGGGGVAGLGVVCNSQNKARGVTGLPQPTGDPFWVDYVSHEIGHQFRANHTFNGNSGSCSGFNRNGATAFEPGSGTTIMAYAGICGNQNIQFNSDDYFHVGSLVEMVSFITNTNSGGSCPEIVDTNNTPPVLQIQEGGFTIPASTPFRLTASATDSDGDDITYTFEQYDTGPAGHPNSPSGNAPLFRSFTGTEVPERTFPRMQNVLNGNQTLGEILPDYTRNLRFRVTARDNNPNGGGIAVNQIQFSVTANAGPFAVPVPGQGTSWSSGQDAVVVWDVAGTDQAPVNAQLVNIRLSTNNGQSFDHTLAEGVPNIGWAKVTLPQVTGNQSRVLVEAADNIFFNVNLSNINISNNPAGGVISLSSESIQIELEEGDSETGSFTLSNTGSGTLNYYAELTHDGLPSGTIPLPFENIDFEGAGGFLSSSGNRELTFEVDSDGLTNGLHAVVVRIHNDSANDTQKDMVIYASTRARQDYTLLMLPPQGWRLFAAPVEDIPLGSFFSNIQTQGFDGADETGEGVNPSVYYQGDDGITPVPDIDFNVEGGRAIIGNIFQQNFPIIININGFPNLSPFEIPLSNTSFTPAEGEGSVQTGWNLAGNPYATALDLRQLEPEDFGDVSRAIYYWNPQLNNGTGGYQVWNGFNVYPDNLPASSRFTGVIPAYNGFWVQALGDAPFMTVRSDMLPSGEGDDGYDGLMQYAFFTLELTAGTKRTYATVFFSDESSEGIDMYDAWQLRSLNSEYAYMYVQSGDDPFVIRSLPLNTESGTLELPLNVESTLSGDFSIRLAKSAGNVNILNSMLITDHDSGTDWNLTSGQAFVFPFEGNGDGPGEQVNLLANVPAHTAAGKEPRFSLQLTLGTPVNTETEHSEIPVTAELFQNYPNPFNPATSIRFGLPVGSEVRLDVYTVTGRHVASLVNGRMNAGYHTVSFDASSLASGVYLYRLETGTQVITRKMTLLK